jgi:hypothetical protein
MAGNMQKWRVRATRILREWRSNIIVWIVQWIGGSAMMSAIGRVAWQEFHRAPSDWYFVGAVFLLGLILVFIGIVLQQKHAISTEEKLKEIEAKIPPPITVNGILAGLPKQNPAPVVSPKLVIHRAIFGAGPQHQIDITERLDKSAREGLVIQVSQSVAPRDPAEGVTKTLEIDYSYDGNHCPPISRQESPGQNPPRLVLPEDSEIPKLRQQSNDLAKQLQQYQRIPDLRLKIVLMCVDLQNFLSRHGDEPVVSRLQVGISLEDTQEYLNRFRSIVEPWRVKFIGEYCLQFGESLPKLRDEMRARASIDDADLNHSIDLAATNRVSSHSAVKTIIAKLWELAIGVNA